MIKKVMGVNGNIYVTKLHCLLGPPNSAFIGAMPNDRTNRASQTLTTRQAAGRLGLPTAELHPLRMQDGDLLIVQRGGF